MEHKETRKYKGYTITLKHDEDPLNPRREYEDELFTMACFHRRYDLGDKHSYSIDEVREIAESSEHISLPLFLYDHSGITMSCARFSCPWDSGQVGLIFAPVSKLKENWPDKSVEELTELAQKSMRAIVKEYDSYLTGDCWGIAVTDPNGKDLDCNCWGFLGQQVAIDEAKACIEYDIKKNDPSLNGSLGF